MLESCRYIIIFVYGFIVQNLGFNIVMSPLGSQACKNKPQRNHFWGSEFLLEAVAQFLEPSTTYTLFPNDLPQFFS